MHDLKPLNPTIEARLGAHADWFLRLTQQEADELAQWILAAGATLATPTAGLPGMPGEAHGNEEKGNEGV